MSEDSTQMWRMPACTEEYSTTVAQLLLANCLFACAEMGLLDFVGFLLGSDYIFGRDMQGLFSTMSPSAPQTDQAVIDLDKMH